MKLFVGLGDGGGYEGDVHAQGDDAEGQVYRIKTYRPGYRHSYAETFVRELCR